MSIPESFPDSCGKDTDDLDLEPEIKEELDHLNLCSSEINRLENELDEARAKYRQTFHEASSKMTQVAQKHKKSIAKAREYFELKTEEKIVQGETLKAARQYQSAISIYKAAKETVALAEDKLVKGGEVQLSSAWQEMLNHATARVMEAEGEKRRSEEQHMKMTKRCAQLEQSLHTLERTRKRSINNARPYFELKHQLDLMLQQQKQNVTDLQSAIRQAKVKYSKSLHKLEEISLAIHESRRQKLLLMYPRQPGVGADCDSLNSSVSELNLDSVDKVSDGYNGDDFSEDEDAFEDANDVINHVTDDQRSDSNENDPSGNGCIDCSSLGLDKNETVSSGSETLKQNMDANNATVNNNCEDNVDSGENKSSSSVCLTNLTDSNTESKNSVENDTDDVKSDLHADD